VRQLFALPVLLLIGAAQTVKVEQPSTAMTHTIEIRNFAFAPARLQVAVGDTVVWINRDVVPHTVTDSLARWDSGEIGAGERWTWVASEAGRFSYLCEYHPSMTGTLEVVEAQALPFSILEQSQAESMDVQQRPDAEGSRRDGW
jgi:plastocyanin